MTEPTRRYEQMEDDLKVANTLNEGLRKQYRTLRSSLMDKSREVRRLNAQVANLVEKNDRQQEMLTDAYDEAKATRNVVLELQAEVLDTRKTAFGDGVLEGRKQGNYKGGWDDGFRHGQAQCNHHPEALTQADAVKFLAEAGKRGIAEGERRLEGLGSVGFDSGFISGKEAGYTDGLAAGRVEGQKRALEDWMQHFILYMQENEQSFAVCRLSDLETMREAVNQASGSSDMIGDIADHLGTIDKVLSRLEHL